MVSELLSALFVGCQTTYLHSERGNGIRERKCTVRAHAHDLNEWAGQPINGGIEIICSIKFVWFHAHCISKRD